MINLDKSEANKAGIADYNDGLAKRPIAVRQCKCLNKDRPLLEHESLDQTFTLQEQRKVSSNLTLHYNRVMYLLQPSELAEGARGKHVQVREYDNGAVRIFLGDLELPARPFPKDNRVSQGAIVSNKLLASTLTAIQSQQQERDRRTLEERRLTRRERANLERAMDAAWPEAGQSADPSEPTVVDSILAHALGTLAARSA